jgi:UDP-glucose 4-epimerase
VLQMLHALGRASHQMLAHEIVARRAGDIAECWADPAAALALLGWQTRRSLDDICADAWRWQQTNPMGYAE